MDNKSKIKICIYINLLIITGIFISFFILNNNQSNYFRFGWADDFIFVSFVIDTSYKYFTLCGFIVFANISDVLTDDIANPILDFTVYNPDKKTITDFTKNELQIYSNIILLIHLIKKFIMLLITISQIDIALISLLSSYISGTLTINFLLNEKKFPQKSNIQMVYQSTGESLPLFNKSNIQI